MSYTSIRRMLHVLLWLGQFKVSHSRWLWYAFCWESHPVQNIFQRKHFPFGYQLSVKWYRQFCVHYIFMIPPKQNWTQCINLSISTFIKCFKCWSESALCEHNWLNEFLISWWLAQDLRQYSITDICPFGYATV